ncbi:MAG: septation protein SepH [Arcanobacterium sp.]|nr:septation protein SepH [Arcanobacterium sp.]
MIELELLGVEPNGEKLNLNDSLGNRYSLAITDKLRAALRQDLPHPNTEAKPITPREVQALFRAGKSVDFVAQVSALPATQLLALERPIMAERLYTAKQARSYRQAHELGGLTIEELVVSRLIDRGVASEGITWDAYRETGEPWNLTATYTVNDLEHTALWRINTKAQAVTALNDEAAWLTETQVPAPVSPWRAHNTPKVEPRVPHGGYPSGAAAGAPANASTTPHALNTPYVQNAAPAELTPVSHIGPVTPAEQSAAAEDPAHSAAHESASDTPLSLVGTLRPHEPAATPDSHSADTADASKSDIDIDSMLASLDSQRGKAQPISEEEFWEADEAAALAAKNSSSTAENSTAAEASATDDGDEPGASHETATVLEFPRQPQLPGIQSAASEPETASEEKSAAAATPPTTTSAAKEKSGKGTNAKQKKRRDRPTMPSWDEIVFGYSKDSHE